jgi:hypothetical protein
MKNLTERLPKDLLKWTAAGFALAATATAEYEIAREIGMNQWIAAAVPGALDAYVVRALRTHREVLTSVVAMVGVNAASHLVTAGILPVEWPLITAVSAIAPLVLWRVHALGTPGEWRARKLWGIGRREHTAVHASTEPEHTEHGRAPDNPEPPGTREHPEHTASTDQARVHAQADAWGDDWLDVHDAVHAPGTPPVHAPSTPPVPVHAPYADHVHAGHTDPEPVLLPEAGNPVMRARHLTVVRGDEHLGSGWCTTCVHDTHNVHGCFTLMCPCTNTPPSTRTADDWNLEHVSTGVLTPEDTAHMERARELFHTLGRVPQFRALKEGTPSMGTPRAKRIRAALKIENEGTD